MPDPLSICHEATVGILRDSPAVRTQIENYQKNILDFTARRLPIRSKVAESDLPELLVVYEGLLPQFYFSSSVVQITQSYHIRISTGDQRVDKFIFPLQFAVLSCMCKAFLGGVYDNLLWNDTPFVQDVVPTNVTAGLSDPEANRGITGWASIFNFTVVMHFGREDLIAVCDGIIT